MEIIVILTYSKNLTDCSKEAIFGQNSSRGFACPPPITTDSFTSPLCC